MPQPLTDSLLHLQIDYVKCDLNYLTLSLILIDLCGISGKTDI